MLTGIFRSITPNFKKIIGGQCIMFLPINFSDFILLDQIFKMNTEEQQITEKAKDLSEVEKGEIAREIF